MVEFTLMVIIHMNSKYPHMSKNDQQKVYGWDTLRIFLLYCDLRFSLREHSPDREDQKV